MIGHAEERVLSRRSSGAGRGAIGRRRHRLTRHLIGVVVACAVALASAATVGAQTTTSVDIPLRTVRTDPGVRTILAVQEVPAEAVGQTCSVEFRAENNSSVHPGNDLVVSSGDESAVLGDVESSPAKVTTATTTLTLGVDITVTLIMGGDGVFSAGAAALVALDCSTTTTTTTTTVPASTTAAPTTTAVEPPTTSVVTTTQPPGPTVGGTVATSVPVSTVPPGGPPRLALTGPGDFMIFLVAALVLLDIGYLTWSTGRPGRRNAFRDD